MLSFTTKFLLWVLACTLFSFVLIGDERWFAVYLFLVFFPVLLFLFWAGMNTMIAKYASAAVCEWWQRHTCWVDNFFGWLVE